MNRAQQLHGLGQSLWLDNITRGLLDDGTLRRYIDEFSITGLTSNPTVFYQAIGATGSYDEGMRARACSGQSTESLFTELALEDLRRTADLFRPTFDATNGLDGWVSMEVSPLLANNTSGSIDAARQIYKQTDRPNLFAKIPGTSIIMAFRQSRSRSSLACRSTLPRCSRGSNTTPLPRLIWAASNAASRPGSTRVSLRLHRYLSAAGTRPRTTGAGRFAQPARHHDRRRRQRLDIESIRGIRVFRACAGPE
jgi:hypothetical protein